MTDQPTQKPSPQDAMACLEQAWAYYTALPDPPEPDQAAYDPDPVGI